VIQEATVFVLFKDFECVVGLTCMVVVTTSDMYIQTGVGKDINAKAMKY
jgi:hypothetical protein